MKDIAVAMSNVDGRLGQDGGRKRDRWYFVIAVARARVHDDKNHTAGMLELIRNPYHSNSTSSCASLNK